MDDPLRVIIAVGVLIIAAIVLIPLLVDDPLRGIIVIAAIFTAIVVLIPLLVDDPLRATAGHLSLRTLTCLNPSFSG